MNDHIGKPFDTGFFYHILAKWIPESKRQELLKSDVSVELRADVGLSALHSIDTEGGLERFVGNEQRYRHWLIKFAEDSSGDLIDIRNALARGELEVVRKSAHSIKGQTGMLGLTDLHTIAAAIEAAVAHGPPPEDMFVSMEQEGKRVCREIASAFALVAQTDHADRTLVHNPDQLKRAERRQRPRANEKLILLIDDDLAVLETLDECLQNRFQTRLAARGLDGLKAAQVQPQPDLILLDIELPDIQGYDICSALKANPQTAAIPVIFLSSHTNVLDITRGLEVGAVDYVTKPVASPILMARVQTHLRLRETGDLLRNQNTHLEIMVGERTRDLEARTLELQRSKDLTIVALGSIAETRDNETGNHIHRTSAYVEVLARRLAVFPAFRDTVSMEQWEVIWKSAPLHDIGKVGIPDHILLKPGKLTPEEFEVMKRHTVLGRDAILSAEARVHSEGSFLRVASEIAYFHHERWNGQGYPEGIAGEEIPLSARLMAVADVYDALTSNRVYKAAISHDDSVDIIRAERGGHFDPRITDCFLEMADDFRTIASAFSDAPTGDKYE
jgi:putative two-component system response regulator